MCVIKKICQNNDRAYFKIKITQKLVEQIENKSMIR